MTNILIDKVMKAPLVCGVVALVEPKFLSSLKKIDIKTHVKYVFHIARFSAGYYL